MTGLEEHRFRKANLCVLTSFSRIVKNYNFCQCVTLTNALRKPVRAHKMFLSQAAAIDILRQLQRAKLKHPGICSALI